MDPLPGRRLAAPVAVAALAGALLVFGAGALYLNYDAAYALLWGHDLLEHGRLPDLELPATPTFHPLGTAVSALLAIPGASFAYHATLGVSLLSYGLLVWVVFRLGEALGSGPAGAVAAVLVAVSVTVVSRSITAFQDIPFTALVLLAALVEVRAPRRGAPVLATLALAGLIRPEAWLMAFAYWLWLRPWDDPRAAAWLAVLAAAAPVLWVLSDLILTGEPFFSLTDTREGAAAAGRVTGIENVPSQASEGLRVVLRPPALVGGALGVALAVWTRNARAIVPAALLVLGLAGFAALGIAELSLLDRYLLVPGALLAVFAGYAIFGWRDEEPGTQRRVWAVGGAALLIAMLAYVPNQVRRLDDVRDGARAEEGIVEDLRRLSGSGKTRAALRRCPGAAVAVFGATPHVALAADVDPAGLRPAQLTPVESGALIGPTPVAVDAAPADSLVRNAPPLPPGFRPALANSTWTLSLRGC